MAEPISVIHLNKENYSEAVSTINELYGLLPSPKGSPHELAETLIVEEGQKRIERLRAEKVEAEKEKAHSGFTIIELLTVMSIIVILISLLVPSLQMVRRYARKVVQKGQFHDIQMGLELFSIDFDGYPDSTDNGVISGDPADAYCGAMKLCEAMLGQDGLGFHPDSKFYREGWSGPGSTGDDLYPEPVLVDNRRERKNPYIDIVGKYKMCSMADLYQDSTTSWGSFAEDSNVISDVFYRIKGQVTAEKLGMPILYYKADIGKLYHQLEPPPPFTPNDNIYDYRDNYELAGLKVIDRTDGHPMYEDPNVFYENTFSKEIAGFRKPYKEESYILISAGWDGLYGTRDDVYNFAE